MNKLGKREYVKLIAGPLNRVYGETLVESDTDLRMANAVLKALNDYLFFDKHDMTDEEFKQWKRVRTPRQKRREEDRIKSQQWHIQRNIQKTKTKKIVKSLEGKLNKHLTVELTQEEKEYLTNIFDGVKKW